MDMCFTKGGSLFVLGLKKVRALFVRSLQILLVMLLLTPQTVSGEAGVFTDTREKLNNITEEEKEVLETLYTMEQEISELEKEAESVSSQIEDFKDEINALEAEIQKDEEDYAKNRDVLKEILQSYQRLGPGTFLEILLDSDSLVTFIRRVNTLRDLTRNTGELMVSLDESKVKLAKEKGDLTQKLVLLEDQQKHLKGLLDSKMALKDEKEDYLTSLEDQRTYYEDFLTEVKVAWEELKPIFTEATNDFSDLVEEGNLPPEALDISFTLVNIKGTIKEEAFNDVIIQHAELPEMVFKFHLGKIELRIPKKNLVLMGNFIVEEDHIMKFVADEGSFYELPLEKGSIEELFEKGYLILNIESLIGDSKLEAVEAQEGSIDLLIKPNLF